MNLLKAWENWKPESPPYLLDSDLNVLKPHQNSKAIASYCCWKEAISDPVFFRPSDRRLHLGLLPQPFFGDVRNAAIYILLLNPGLSPTDYYGEYEVPGFRETLLANLKQQHQKGMIPFLFLDPQFSWHAGFHWWHGKLVKVIECLASGWKVSFAAAQRRLGATLASIELLPYHSLAFEDGGNWLRNLSSVVLARDFVKEFVHPRVKSGEAIVIATRKVAYWDLPDHDGVVKYTAAQARAAHLTPDSPGGRPFSRICLSPRGTRCCSRGVDAEFPKGALNETTGNGVHGLDYCSL